MALYEFQPSPALKAFIRVYRIVHFVFDDPTDIPYKPYPPRAEHCLSFYPRDTEKVAYSQSGQEVSNLKIAIIGQQCEVTNRYVGKDFLVFQVVFRAGGLYRITGIPSNELTNSYIDAEAIFPHLIREVNERLNEVGHFTGMVKIVETFLQQICHNAKTLHALDQVSHLILQSTEIPSIESLAKASCLSLRQFERKFVERMGVSPKYYCKVVRFENAYRMRNLLPHLDWLSVAIQCGYYDYQHLVKDYKTLTNQSPNEFHLMDMAAPERKFGVADTY